MSVFARFLRKVFRRHRLRQDLEAELAFHRDMAASSGVVVPFGNASLVKESVLDLWRFNLVENLWRDLAYGVRRLSKSRGFTFAVLISLSLGIGIASGMFALLNAVVFRPLPYAQESRLVWFTEVLKANSTDEITITADFLDWRRSNHSFDDIAGVNPQTSIVTRLGRPFEIHGARVSASLLNILSVRPMLGRNFTRQEDIAGGGHVIIVTHAFWRNHLGADRAAIGKVIAVDGEPYTLIGVLPASFVFPSDRDDQFLIPLAKNENAEVARDGRVLTVVHGVVGRLKAGVTLAQAHAEITAIQSHLPVPPFHPTITIKMLALRTFLFGDQKLAAIVFVSGAVLFLIIASANLGNLALSQLLHREREVAVRRALGAGRCRIVAQLVIENALLGFAASIAGLFIAWGVRNLLASMPSYSAAIYSRLPLDLRVVLFTTFLLGVVLVVFGLIPAIRISDRQLASAMRTMQSGASAGKGHLRFLSIVASVEVAIVVALSISAALMLMSFQNMRYRHLGIETEHVAVARLNLSAPAYRNLNREMTFFDGLLARIETIPGIEAEALSVADEIPPGAWHAANTARIDGRPLPVDSRQKPLTRSQVVSGEYFKVLGVPLINGRFLQDTDGPAAPHVVVISSEFVRRYFPGENPIGHRLKASDMRDDVWYTVVGIVGDVKSSGLAAGSEPVVYVPYRQSGGVMLRSLGLIVRSALPLASIAPALRDAVTALDPEQPLSSIESLDERLNQSVARPRFAAGLLSILSVLGTLLAVVGVYGLVACRVRSQLREFAVRQALGAPAGSIISQIVKNAAQVTVTGLICGLLISLAASRVLAAMLFEVSPRDPIVLAGASALVLLASLSACLLPAWKATRTDPLIVLRET